MAGGYQCSREVPLLLRTSLAFCGSSGSLSPSSAPPPDSQLPAPWVTLPQFLENTSHFLASGPWHLSPLPGTHFLTLTLGRAGSLGFSLGSHLMHHPVREAPFDSPNPMTVPVRDALPCSGSLGAQVSNKHPWEASLPPGSRVAPLPQGGRAGDTVTPSPSSLPANRRAGSGGAWSQASSLSQEIGLGGPLVAGGGVAARHEVTLCGGLDSLKGAEQVAPGGGVRLRAKPVQQH